MVWCDQIDKKQQVFNVKFFFIENGKYHCKSKAKHCL